MTKEEKITLDSIKNDEKNSNYSDVSANEDATVVAVNSSSDKNSDELKVSIEINLPLKKSETLEGKLWKFKRDSSGIMSEIRKREHYDKPSVRRKKKSKEARRRKKTFRFHNTFK